MSRPISVGQDGLMTGYARPDMPLRVLGEFLLQKSGELEGKGM